MMKKNLLIKKNMKVVQLNKEIIDYGIKLIDPLKMWNETRGENVKIAENVTIMPFAVIDDNAEIGSGAIIYPHVYIGQFAKIGENSVIYSNTTIREYCQIGKNCVIHPSTVIGADGTEAGGGTGEALGGFHYEGAVGHQFEHHGVSAFLVESAGS